MTRLRTFSVAHHASFGVGGDAGGGVGARHRLQPVADLGTPVAGDQVEDAPAGPADANRTTTEAR